MSLLRQVLPVAAVLLLTNCGALSFTVEEQSRSTIEGAGLLGYLLDTLDLAGLDGFDMSIEREMEDQGVEPGDLESVRLTRLALSAEPDLSFLASIEVYVSAEGLSELRVASSGSFPEGQPTVELVLEDAELADFVVAGGMSFRAAVTGTPPTDDTVLTVEVEAEVEATAQGACNAAKG